MGKLISSERLTETLTLSEHTDGFWLYDYTIKMNLSIRAKTPQDAYIECITYYQRRLRDMETRCKMLTEKFDAIVAILEEINNDD